MPVLPRSLGLYYKYHCNEKHLGNDQRDFDLALLLYLLQNAFKLFANLLDLSLQKQRVVFVDPLRLQFFHQLHVHIAVIELV